jgi:hypothetical protein
MHGDGAKITLPITTAVGGNGKLDSFQGFDFSLLLIKGVLSTVIIKAVNSIQFGLCQREWGWIMNKISATVFLVEPLAVRASLF